MHEDWTKYAPEHAPRVATGLMVDAPVILFAGRTAPEVLVPLMAGMVLLLVFHQLVLALAVSPLLFGLMPVMRRRLGRGRARHLLWRLGVPAAGIPTLFGPRRRRAVYGP